MNKLAAFVAGATLSALAAGCSEAPTTNTNANSNTAVVVNTNNANTANANTANTNTANANTNTRMAPTREEYEKNKESYSKEAKDMGRKVGTGANDGWLWVKARYDLAAADDLRDSTINVDVDNGVITLTGTVGSQDQVKKADSIAKAVEGQKGVKNMLKVSAGGSTNANANGNKNANANANHNANANAKH